MDVSVTHQIIGSIGPRQETLGTAYRKTREFTEQLAAPLSAEDQTVQSMPDVSPTKWHRGHTSWFFETFVLAEELAGYRVAHPAYAYIFNSYYESVGARHPRAERGLVSRPGVAEVAAYRRHVDSAMGDLLSGTLTPEVRDVVELGVHHEQQHQELMLMDIKHVLSKSPLRPAYEERLDPEAQSFAPGRRTAKPQWVEHPGGQAEIGHAAATFCFDNELPRHTELLVPHAVSDRLVTCGEWLEFVDDGGYRRPELWLSDGWAAVQAQRWSAPLYWGEGEDSGELFTLFGPRALDSAEPAVHVSYFEADAFARWSDARLPTEAEWEEFAASRAGDAASPTPDARRGSDAGGAPSTQGAPHSLHPSRAGGARDPAQLFGAVWQWTSSSYGPYPGFRTAPGAVGEYNGKFMVNQQVLRGSACVTPPGHARATYRNFFPASARWPFAGVRLARDL